MKKNKFAFLAWMTAVLATAGAAWGQVVVPPLDLNPLNQIAVPEPPNLYQYVTNKQVAIQLGKAFFWDMQAGSDGIVACATCHFHAGADNRMKNTVNPGARAGDTTFQVVGPNDTLLPSHFPFHQRQYPAESQSDPVLRDANDVVGSQGVRRADFVDIVPGSAVDIVTPVPDPIFQVNGVNVRQVTGRNAPTVINSIFNFSQFWDGRANYIFNGENPFGLADPEAGLWFNDFPGGLVKRPIDLIFASLASLATAPVLDDVEMSARGRTLPQVGRKLLSLTPLGKQYVSHDDSVLGGLAQSASIPGARGLHTGYAELIRLSFQADLWDSDQLVTLTLSSGQPAQFTHMEANFAFFWGVSIQLYLATLVSDQTPLDHWLGGDDTALTDQQKQGFALFSGIAKCNLCHIDIEFTTASHTVAMYLDDDVNALIDPMFVADGTQVIYDTGFNNTAVTKTTDDIARGGTAPFTNPLTGEFYPLSFSARSELRALDLMPFSTPLLNPGIPANMTVNAKGTFKVPTLRNVELTAPFFHNGSIMDMDDMMDFLIRGGNFPNENIRDLDPDIGAGIPFMRGREDMEHAVIEFLNALTDWRVRAEASPFDHPELFIPNGVADDGTEVLIRIAARNAYGTAIGTAVTVDVPGAATRDDSLTISGTVEAGAAIPDVWVDTGAACGPVTVDGTTWSAKISGLVEGENVVTVTVFDSSGLEVVTTATITVDTVPPALALNPITTPTGLAVQAITGTREAGAAVQVSVNGGPPVSATGSGISWTFSASLEPGENTISVTAVDAAGNLTELPAQTIFVDGSGPGSATQPPPLPGGSATQPPPDQGAVGGGGGGGGCFIDSIASGFSRIY
jgi:cytochrome c peroxidase